MVQLFYHEQRGGSWRKILRHEGSPTKILLFADEGWARAAPTAYWLVRRPWWSRSRCQVVEVRGQREVTTVRARLVDKGRGQLCIKGRFKGQEEDGPDFRMRLTSHVTSADFRQGYSLTGTLERGNKKKGDMRLTHFAMLQRKDYFKEDDNNNK